MWNINHQLYTNGSRLKVPSITTRRRRARLVLSLVVLVSQLGGPEARADPRAAALREEIGRIADRIDAGRGARDAAAAALEQAERAIVELIAERDALVERMDAIGERVAVLDAATADASERLPALRRELDEALATRYRLDRTTRASILLDRDDPAEVQRMMTYFDYLLNAQTARIETLRDELDAIVSARDELLAQRAALAQARREHDDKVAALRARQAQRNAQLDDITDRLARDASLLAEKREEKARLDALLDDIEQLRRDSPPPPPPPARTAPPSSPRPDEPAPPVIRLDGLAHLKGALPLPVGGRVSTRFREPDALSGVPSSGVVIESGDGADVRSVSDGQVVYSGWFRGYGLLLVIDHGDGYMSLYGYNSRLLYPIGASVKAGAAVAKAGSTGGRTRAGVYFEIRHGGDALDPLEWCRVQAG